MKEVAKRVNDIAGVKESDTGLAPPSRWDLVSDKQAMQEEQPLQVRFVVAQRASPLCCGCCMPVLLLQCLALEHCVCCCHPTLDVARRFQAWGSLQSEVCHWCLSGKWLCTPAAGRTLHKDHQPRHR